jgi:hypothetical protein
LAAGYSIIYSAAADSNLVVAAAMPSNPGKLGSGRLSNAGFAKR